MCRPRPRGRKRQLQCNLLVLRVRDLKLPKPFGVLIEGNIVQQWPRPGLIVWGMSNSKTDHSWPQIWPMRLNLLVPSLRLSVHQFPFRANANVEDNLDCLARGSVFNLLQSQIQGSEHRNIHTTTMFRRTDEVKDRDA
jgi:hypothetical protein